MSLVWVSSASQVPSQQTIIRFICGLVGQSGLARLYRSIANHWVFKKVPSFATGAKSREKRSGKRYPRLDRFYRWRVWSSSHKLAQARAAEALQVVLPVGFQFDRHLACNPGKRNIGLRAAKFLQCSGGNISFAGHAGGRRQHAPYRTRSG